MPTYEYECTRCGHIFEMFQSITAKPKKRPDEPCAGCGERAEIRRLIGGGGAVLFKGSGFYETDYRSESYKKAAKAESESVTGKSEKAKDSAAGNDKSAPASGGGKQPAGKAGSGKAASGKATAGKAAGAE